MKKSSLSSIILVIMLIVGMGLLLYPTVSDYWNSFHQSRTIASYAEAVAGMDDNDYAEVLAAARLYNQKLSDVEIEDINFMLTEEEIEEYNALLDITGTGIMGYIEIAKIGCSLPIYHGIEESVLQIAIGHIAGSSLPVGGEKTHSVLSGHRGLPSARLFSDLDELVKGDEFVIRVFDEIFTYEVDQILIVEPEDISSLVWEEEEDLCTLVTCTPYGINSHRLLVRGHRVSNTSRDIRVTADAILIRPVMVAPMLAIPVLVLLLVWMLISTGKSSKRGKIKK